jgi:hypothetical protein
MVHVCNWFMMVCGYIIGLLYVNDNELILYILYLINVSFVWYYDHYCE